MLTMFDIDSMEKQSAEEHAAYMQRHEAYLANRIKILELLKLARSAQENQKVEE